MADFERYVHRGFHVAVRTDLRGQHRDYCLCESCTKMKPGTPDHCPLARAVEQNCQQFGLVTPVWQCPDFEEHSSGEVQE